MHRRPSGKDKIHSLCGAESATTYHVTDASSRETIETALDLGDGDDVKILGPRVIGAVHNGGNGET